MKFQLIASLRTGIPGLDDDHDELISRINDMVRVEQASDIPALRAALADFKSALSAHFQEEDAHLREIGYPLARAHALHHAEILAALERLQRERENNQLIGGSIAKSCYHQLIIDVLKHDMEFVNWLAETRFRAKPNHPRE